MFILVTSAPKWGSNSQPQDQELHTLLTEPGRHSPKFCLPVLLLGANNLTYFSSPPIPSLTSLTSIASPFSFLSNKFSNIFFNAYNLKYFSFSGSMIL